MPVYDEQTFLYEVLLRFGEIDPNKGKLVGASQTKITQLLKDGKLLSSTIESPEQLATVDGEDGAKLADVLGEVNSATIIANGVLTGQVDSLTASLTQAQTDAAGLRDSVTQLESQLNDAQVEIDRLNALLAQSRAEAADQLAALQQVETPAVEEVAEQPPTA